MAVSTGAQILDDAAVSAFRGWRFKPGTVSKVRLPITFTLAFGRGSVVMEVRVLKAPHMDQASAPFLGKENVIKRVDAGLSCKPAVDIETRPRRL